MDHACVFMIVHGCDVHVHKFRYIDDYQDRLNEYVYTCLLYTSPSPRDATLSRMPSSA